MFKGGRPKLLAFHKIKFETSLCSFTCLVAAKLFVVGSMSLPLTIGILARSMSLQS